MNILKRKPLLLIIGILVIIVVTTVLVFLLQQKRAVAPATSKTTASPSVIRPSFVATGLNSPTNITAAPNSSTDKLFITELAGTIRTLSPSEKPTVIRPFLDITSKVHAGGEMGLLGLAFHPDYAKNGYFFVNYIDKEQNTVVARYKLASNGTLADPDSEKVMFWIRQPYPNHNGGALAFGPDGYLYIAMGDGGSAGDPEKRAQDKNSYFGKILRIDVNNADVKKGKPYLSPATNPFFDQKDVLPEIWAYGLRNPWRMSFDTVTNDLFIADVGQDKAEEIDLQSASSKGGENYGWRCKEGTQDFNTAGCSTTTKYVAPILSYAHENDRCSVTGGYKYHGTAYPGLTDKYFYADYCSGELFYGAKNGDTWKQSFVIKTPYTINTFGQDTNGEVYFTDYTTGALYKLVDAR
jgi:glucose/arabinose dehydrogenase